MEPYNADYDMYSTNQEAAIRDEILHDIWLCHQRIERSMTHDNTLARPVTCDYCGFTIKAENVLVVDGRAVRTIMAWCPTCGHRQTARKAITDAESRHSVRK